MRKTILLFSLALLLCSCATTKRTSNTGQSTIDKDVQARLDSLLHSQVAAQLERLAVMEGEAVTDLIVFDTDKPPADSTGLPPVKAILRKQTSQRQRSQEKAAVHAETDVQVSAETADRSMEVSQTAQVEEKKPSAGMGVLRLGIGALLLAVSAFAIWIFYKRIKR